MPLPGHFTIIRICANSFGNIYQTLALPNITEILLLWRKTTISKQAKLWQQYLPRNKPSRSCHWCHYQDISQSQIFMLILSATFAKPWQQYLPATNPTVELSRRCHWCRYQDISQPHVFVLILSATFAKPQGQLANFVHSVH